MIINFPELTTVHKELDELRKYYQRGKINPPLYDALQLIIKNKITPPEWVMEGVQQILADRLKLPAKKGKSVMNNEITKYKQIVRKFRRWQTVQHFVDQGYTQDESFQKAKSILGESLSKVRGDTIKKSYLSVRKALNDPIEKYKYYDASSDVYALMEIPAIELPRP